MFSRIAFPLVKDVVRDVWVVLELITVIIGITLSIATLSLEHNSVFNLFTLVLVCISSLLALVDGVHVLKDCRSCRACCGREKEENETQKSSYSDILRMIASEVLIYPLLICNIFKVTTGRSYQGETHLERFGFALFIVSCLSLLFYGYVIRLVAIVGMLKGVSETRTPSEEAQARDQDTDFYDSSIRVSASLYQIYFAAHVFLQMLVQVFMIVAIGGKIRYEYRHFYGEFDKVISVLNFTSSDNATGVDQSTSMNFTSGGNVTDQSIRVSNHLWYMIITGYFLPLLGLFTFFFVTYYWTQEFPIGLYLDMVNIWKKGSRDDVLETKKKEEARKQISQRVLDFFYDDFQNLRNVSFWSKAVYPFKSPAVIVMCVSYGLLLATFVICAAVTYDQTGTLVVQILNGGGWVLYFTAACIIGAVANLYVLLVAAVWVTIIILVILLLICTCLSACLGDEKEKK